MTLKSLRRFSKEAKQEPNFWARYLWVLVINGLVILFVWIYKSLATQMINIKPEYQWILALLVPLLREVSIWTLLKAVSKAAVGFSPNEMTVYHSFETRYAVFLSIILGSIATAESSYCLIAIDFLTNLYHGIKIVKKSKAGEEG